MAEFGFHVNRKQKIGMRGPFKDGHPAPRREGDYILFEYLGEGYPPKKSDENENGWRPLSRDDAAVSLPHVEAWRWFRGEHNPGDSAAPTVDQMIETIAAKLREEMAETMDAALRSEDSLFHIYRVAKGNSGRLTRPAW